MCVLHARLATVFDIVTMNNEYIFTSPLTFMRFLSPLRGIIVYSIYKTSEQKYRFVEILNLRRIETETSFITMYQAARARVFAHSCELEQPSRAGEKH